MDFPSFLECTSRLVYNSPGLLLSDSETSSASLQEEFNFSPHHGAGSPSNLKLKELYIISLTQGALSSSLSHGLSTPTLNSSRGIVGQEYPRTVIRRQGRQHSIIRLSYIYFRLFYYRFLLLYHLIVSFEALWLLCVIVHIMPPTPSQYTTNTTKSDQKQKVSWAGK
jgi:hypothetical protein